MTIHTGIIALIAIHFVSFWYVLFWSSLGYYELQLYGLRVTSCGKKNSHAPRTKGAEDRKAQRAQRH